MENIRVTVDAEFRKELTSHVDEMSLKATFEKRYGRGWQRKLSAVLDVPETTVSGWFKSGKFPALAKLSFGALLSQGTRPLRRWVPIKNGAGYAVCDIRKAVGRIVADNVPSLSDAMLIAAAPQLYEAAGTAFPVFNDSRDAFEGWGDIADELGAALDGVDYSCQEEEEVEEQEG